MCDQSEVQYNDGDVVWVKLGPCWWPGEVHDIKKVPPEIQPGLKKPPIAFVHFFGEDKYEYVKSLDHIYHYNCRRKDEFLKKGFHAYRAKHKHMGKFPDDVKTAETLTNGDPNIMESEKYRPEEKINYRNIFASPSPSKKSTPKSGGKPGRGRKSSSATRHSTGDKYYRRNSLNPYLDYNYEVHELSGESELHASITIENSSTNVVYDCPKCNFTCTRLNVIILHHKTHNLDEFDVQLKGKKKIKDTVTNKLPRIARCFTSTIDEDLELLSKGIDICSYNDTSKRKFKSPKIKLPKTPKPTTEKKKINNKKDVKGILADWEDSESEKEDEKLDKTNNVDKTIQSNADESSINNLLNISISNKDSNKSCFDFEEEEEIATIISKSPGRKIPRVIPESQKTKSPESVTIDIPTEVNDQSKISSPNVTIDEINTDNLFDKKKENEISDTENKNSGIENKNSEDDKKSITTETSPIKSKGKRGRKSKVELEEIRRQEMTKENESQEVKDNLEKEFDLLMAETVLSELPALPSVDSTLKQTEDTIETTKLSDKKTRGRKKSESVKQDVEPVLEQPDLVSPVKNKKRNKRKSEHQVLKEKSPEIVKKIEVEVTDDIAKQTPLETAHKSSKHISQLEPGSELPKIEKRARKRTETLKEKILESVMQAEREESKQNKKKVEIVKAGDTETIKPSKKRKEITKDAKIKEQSPIAEFVQTVLKIEDKRGRRKSELFLKDKSPEFVEDKKTERKGDFKEFKGKSPEPVAEELKDVLQSTLKDKSPELSIEKENDITKTNRRGRKKSESSFKEKSSETISEKEISSLQIEDKIDLKEKPTDSTINQEDVPSTETRSRKRNSSLKDQNKIETETVQIEKVIEQTEHNLQKSVISCEQIITPVDKKQTTETIVDEPKPESTDDSDVSKIETLPKKSRRSRLLSLKEKDDVGNHAAIQEAHKEKHKEIPKEITVTEETKSHKNIRDKFEFIPKKTRRNRQEFKFLSEYDSLQSSEPLEKRDSIKDISSDKLEDTSETIKTDKPSQLLKTAKIKKMNEESNSSKVSSETHEIVGEKCSPKRLSRREKLDEELMEYVLETNKDLKHDLTDVSVDKNKVSEKDGKDKETKSTSKPIVETDSSNKIKSPDIKNVLSQDIESKSPDTHKEIIDQTKNIESFAITNLNKTPEKSKSIRKRGRPSNASKAATGIQEITKSESEEFSRENHSLVLDTKEAVSTMKEEIRPIKPTEDKNIDISDKNLHKSESDLEANKKNINESVDISGNTKSDESVKVMISLNDFKMEDIPLPPSPAPKSSITNLNLSIETVEQSSKVEEKIDNIVNTSKESKEMKRTPIKFEISKIKAQINKKLITHKSFLGDEEDSLAFVRKGQTFIPERTVSNLKRKDFIKECESPKKRVMADYKKEIDMEKSKQKKMEEKVQTEMEKVQTEMEKVQDEIKKQELQEKEIILTSDISEDSVSKFVNVTSIDKKIADDTVVPEKVKTIEEKLTTIPIKHEDVSGVINSDTDVKITDPNSKKYVPDQSEQKIVHENITDQLNSVEESVKCDSSKSELHEQNKFKTNENQDKLIEPKALTADVQINSKKIDEGSEIIPEIENKVSEKDGKDKETEIQAISDSQLAEPGPIFEDSKKDFETEESKPNNENQSTLPNYVDELESIENEIQKITSSESSPCKANIFPENIAMATTPTKENLTLNEPILESKELYPSQLSEVHDNVLMPTPEVKSSLQEDPVSESNDNSIESEIAKLTDTKPEEGEVLPEQSYSTTSSKLLEILESKSDSKVKVEKKIVPVSLPDKRQTFIGLTAAQKKSITLGNKIFPAAKGTKFVIKSSTTIKDNKKSKPIILSEEIIKPANDSNKSVSPISASPTASSKGATKRNFEEDLLEDKGGIKKFIIEKAVADSSTQSGAVKTSRAKPTVISQTIIKSTTGKLGENTGEANKETIDDNMFDINSMPIVLSDDLLTPESIENMPIVISNITESDKSSKTLQVISKSKFVSQQKNVGVKTVMQQNITKNQKIYQAASTKLLTNKPAVITQPGKPEKFIILPPATASPASGSKYTVGKRTIRANAQTSVVVSKSPTAAVSTATTIVDAKTKSALQAGNKVMVVTNSQGQQSRIILSPAQQKMLGSKMGTKIITRTTPVTKGTTLALNNIVTSKGTILTPTSTLVQTKTQAVSPQTVITSKGQILTTSVQSQSIITSKGQILTPVTPTQMKAIKSGSVTSGKKIQIPQKIILPAGAASKSNLQSIAGVKTKTVLVKGNQKQIIQKIQPSTSTSQLRTVVQKGSPTIKAASSTVSSIISGKQKVAIAPKTPNVIKRQVVRSQNTGSTQSNTPQRVILQKMPSSEVKQNTTIQRISQPKSIEPKLFPKQTRSSSVVSSGQNVPPLVPLSPSQAKIVESTLPQQSSTGIVGAQTSGILETAVQSPKQLIIQDDMGNQTSVSQGQILAVPGGEVIDGQPQSYMLVTVDESGNLLPLDNQALMSLDPSLIGPDGNVMLQFNQGINPSESQPSLPVSNADALTSAIESTEISSKVQSQTVAIESPAQDYQQLLITDDQQNLIALTGADQHLLMTENQNLILDQAVLQSPKTTSEQAVTYSISNAEDGQQILISGDPEKAQHLINVLASGSQDLSQIMSNTEGNLIINADGQHIILNSDSGSTEQIILATSTDGFSLQENYNSDFATQATTNQDILAAALANTVFPQESNITEGLNIVTSATGGPLMSTTSELSPSLYQNMQLPNLTSGAVLETSLTNLAPIMSPLEVPTSGTSKKVPLDIETTSQVPKSLELPITITDPNISQTVNSQLANELQNNLGLPITITDPNISNVRSSELNTSSFGYSLPNIEDSVEIATTTNSGPISMPLLTEDLETESSQPENKSDDTINKDVIEQPQKETTQPEELNTIFESNKSNSERNENEDIESAGNALDVLASVTTASGMISENNAELEHIFAEKKDVQLPSEVFAQNTYLNENDGKENNDCESNSVVHEPFSRSRLGDHFVLESPHSEIDANSDEISIQPSIVTDEASHSLSENSHKRSFDGLEDECSSSDSKKSKFDIS